MNEDRNTNFFISMCKKKNDRNSNYTRRLDQYYQNIGDGVVNIFKD